MRLDVIFYPSFLCTHRHTSLFLLCSPLFFPLFQFALCFFFCFSYYFFSLFCCNPSTILCFFRCLCNCSCCLRSCLSCLFRYRIDSLCGFSCTSYRILNSSSSVPNNTTFFQLSCCITCCHCRLPYCVC